MKKREFFVEDYKKLSKYLQKKSLTCKLYRYKDKNSYMYEFQSFSAVLEEYKTYKKLVVFAKKEVILDKNINRLIEVTDDKRYSNEYIELFGLPSSYEFDEKKVFEKCDKARLSRLDLHFKDGMSSGSVFKVILYRLNQIFTLQYALFLQKELEYESLEKSHAQLVSALKMSKKIFDKKIVKQIQNDAEDLYMLINHQETFERYVLNLQMFIYEKDFYNSKLAKKPIYFYDKKDELYKLIEGNI